MNKRSAVALGKSDYIKRFKQAWLLGPDNQLVVWDFAVFSLGREQFEEADRYFRSAIAAGPSSPSLQQDYEYFRKKHLASG